MRPSTVGPVQQFELLDDRHHHLICRACGDSIDVDDTLVAPLRAALRDRYGFVAGIDHLAIFGMCDFCERDAERRENLDDRG
jgi:Fur family transcriptional regulator, ferric uptake regulator